MTVFNFIEIQIKKLINSNNLLTIFYIIIFIKATDQENNFDSSFEKAHLIKDEKKVLRFEDIPEIFPFHDENDRKKKFQTFQ